MKNINIEKKIYESLGIKQFRKMAMAINALIIKDPQKRDGGNYYLDKSKGFAGLKAFKRHLRYNSLVHSEILIINVLILFFTTNTFTVTFLSFFIALNAYCVMLQRYNCVRINDVMKKHDELLKRRKERLKKNENDDQLEKSQIRNLSQSNISQQLLPNENNSYQITDSLLLPKDETTAKLNFSEPIDFMDINTNINSSFTKIEKNMSLKKSRFK